MHSKAKEWDKEHGVDTSWNNDGILVKWPQDRPVPKGRPCDWCGLPVKVGFIHRHCAEKERDFWLDLLY